MSWLNDLLKHLELSKPFAGALFISSLALLVGPKLAPNAIEAVPSQWRWLVAGTCIFSGALLSLWALPKIWNGALGTTRRVSNSHRFNPLTDRERGFIAFLGEHHPNDSANLEYLRFQEISKLEILQICAVLHRRGLVNVNRYNDNLVDLTAAGRKHALELLQRAKA